MLAKKACPASSLNRKGTTTPPSAEAPSHLAPSWCIHSHSTRTTAVQPAQNGPPVTYREARGSRLGVICVVPGWTHCRIAGPALYMHRDIVAPRCLPPFWPYRCCTHLVPLPVCPAPSCQGLPRSFTPLDWPQQGPGCLCHPTIDRRPATTSSAPCEVASLSPPVRSVAPTPAS